MTINFKATLDRMRSSIICPIIITAIVLSLNSFAVPLNDEISNHFLVKRGEIHDSLGEEYVRLGKIFVAQHDYAITQGDDAYPILMTDGMEPCFSIVGYHQASKIGFLTHFDSYASFKKGMLK